jgi:hypothetical protein
VVDVTPKELERSNESRHTGAMPPSPDALRLLHDRYVAAINVAVSADDHDLIDQLSAEYELEALALLSPAA